MRYIPIPAMSVSQPIINMSVLYSTAVAEITATVQQNVEVLKVISFTTSRCWALDNNKKIIIKVPAVWLPMIF